MQRPRIHYTERQKALMWERWQKALMWERWQNGRDFPYSERLEPHGIEVPRLKCLAINLNERGSHG